MYPSIYSFFLFCRQLGAPTLFLTLSSNETAWDDLLISILKTKKDIRDVKELITDMKTESINGIPKEEFLNQDETFIKANCKEIVEEMTKQERSRFVNANIVLTTIEFQNRVQHIFKVNQIHMFFLSSILIFSYSKYLDS